MTTFLLVLVAAMILTTLLASWIRAGLEPDIDEPFLASEWLRSHENPSTAFQRFTYRLRKTLVFFIQMCSYEALWVPAALFVISCLVIACAIMIVTLPFKLLGLHRESGGFR